MMALREIDNEIQISSRLKNHPPIIGPMPESSLDLTTTDIHEIETHKKEATEAAETELVLKYSLVPVVNPLR